MTFASMTGFAESTGSHEGLRWRWEAKSVNSRSLDLRLRIPPGYDALEAPVRRLAGERFLRGALQLSLSIETLEGVRGLAVDAAALASAVRIAREVAAETGLAPARVDGLLALKGVIVSDDGVPALAPRTDDQHYFDWHHTEADTLDKVDPVEFRKNVAMLSVVVYVLADMDGRLAGRKGAATE